MMADRAAGGRGANGASEDAVTTGLSQPLHRVIHSLVARFTSTHEASTKDITFWAKRLP